MQRAAQGRCVHKCKHARCCPARHAPPQPPPRPAPRARYSSPAACAAWTAGAAAASSGGRAARGRGRSGARPLPAMVEPPADSKRPTVTWGAAAAAEFGVSDGREARPRERSAGAMGRRRGSSGARQRT
jgi:hypothetical protein